MGVCVCCVLWGVGARAAVRHLHLGSFWQAPTQAGDATYSSRVGVVCRHGQKPEVTRVTAASDATWAPIVGLPRASLAGHLLSPFLQPQCACVGCEVVARARRIRSSADERRSRARHAH
jgi:hypothetical protein